MDNSDSESTTSSSDLSDDSNQSFRATIMGNFLKIKKMETSKGRAVSYVTIFIPHQVQMRVIKEILDDEIDSITRLESRTNRVSLLTVLSAMKERLKIHRNAPLDGLIMLGLASVKMDGSPIILTAEYPSNRPVERFLFMCENAKHSRVSSRLPTDEDTFGFIIVQDNWTVQWGTLQGKVRKVLYDTGTYHNYYNGVWEEFAYFDFVKRIHVMTKKLFMTGNKFNIAALIMGLNPHMNSRITSMLVDSIFEIELAMIWIAKLEINNTGEVAFHEAVYHSGVYTQDYKEIIDANWILRLKDEVDFKTDKFCFGLNKTIPELIRNNVLTLYYWQKLEIFSYHLFDRNTGKDLIVHSTLAQAEVFFSKVPDGTFLLMKREPFLHWLRQNYKRYCYKYVLVPDDRVEELVSYGFHGMGALLRESSLKNN